MKKFLTTISLLLLAVACTPTPNGEGEEPQPEQPNFPEAVVENVLPGSHFTLNIEPNYDWEVAIPQSVAAYYSIVDGENIAYKVRGEAGTHTVTIAVADVQLFDEQPVCEVTMTMQGQSELIATLTMTATARELKIYPVAIENDAFSYATEGEQTYPTRTVPGRQVLTTPHDPLRRQGQADGHNHPPPHMTLPSRQADTTPTYQPEEGSSSWLCSGT